MRLTKAMVAGQTIMEYDGHSAAGVRSGNLHLRMSTAQPYHGESAMKKMSRRDFVRTLTLGGAALSLGNAIRHKPLEAQAGVKIDIGQCRSVRIRCISEPGWFDDRSMFSTWAEGDGPEESQWEKPWDYSNAAGSCALIDMETLDGRHHRFLMDTGWGREYMDGCFKRERIDRMLGRGDVEFLVITHEHLDHYWGVETALRYNPEIRIYIPETFFLEGTKLLMGADYITAGVKNFIVHGGKLIKCRSGHINKLYDGCALVAFDLPIELRVRGEQSLYFNVKDKGIVCVTGCCHQTIPRLADFARKKILGGENLYGLYGGLHIAPFGPLTPEAEKMVHEIGKYGFKKMACNHCTGLTAVKRMVELGYPVVKGSGKFGSKSDLYVGNGDQVLFG
jgi:7,8-dihydropterin-6-yl-methyl-4-(beta-D-ribofuranosyl)aminobenzene 5'-phosphate synthase